MGYRTRLSYYVAIELAAGESEAWTTRGWVGEAPVKTIHANEVTKGPRIYYPRHSAACGGRAR